VLAVVATRAQQVTHEMFAVAAPAIVGLVTQAKLEDTWESLAKFNEGES
jgi:hypothetical protein